MALAKVPAGRRVRVALRPSLAGPVLHNSHIRPGFTPLFDLGFALFPALIAAYALDGPVEGLSGAYFCIKTEANGGLKTAPTAAVHAFHSRIGRVFEAEASIPSV